MTNKYFKSILAVFLRICNDQVEGNFSNLLTLRIFDVNFCSMYLGMLAYRKNAFDELRFRRARNGLRMTAMDRKRRLGLFLGVQNSGFQYFWGFSEK